MLACFYSKESYHDISWHEFENGKINVMFPKAINDKNFLSEVYKNFFNNFVRDIEHFIINDNMMNGSNGQNYKIKLNDLKIDQIFLVDKTEYAVKM